MREQMAKQERQEKELEGCTFAPVLMTKAKKVRPANQEAEGYDEEEPEDVPQRDINKFLEDQKKFDDERKMK